MKYFEKYRKGTKVWIGIDLPMLWWAVVGLVFVASILANIFV